jgi:hypothetical protein
MPTYIFETPTFEEGPAGTHRLFQFYRLTKSYTVINQGGTYSLTRFPLDEDLPTYTAYYIGGTKNSVTEGVKTALIASGLGITEANFTVE